MSSLLTTSRIRASKRRTALNMVAGAAWYVPGSFGIARVLGSEYSLRSVLFHEISDGESPFTKGLGVTVTRKQFEDALKFIIRHYTPVSLQDILTDFDGKRLPPRPAIVTFDDAYASVSEFAAPLCSQYGVPAIFFVNGTCIDNKQLALDNLVCYVANVHGLEPINGAIRSVGKAARSEVSSLKELFSHFLPRTLLASREAFRQKLIELTGINDGGLASESGLYLSSQQLRDLAQFNVELGNHTYTHANCRTLSATDFSVEIDKNKAMLESISGSIVRSFSVPYGSSVDLTSDLCQHLQRSGYKATFLAEGQANPSTGTGSHLDRISLKAGSGAAFFSEIEILPRLRRIRNRLVSRSRARSTAREKPPEQIPTSWPGAATKDSGTVSQASRRNLGV
jgi:peptidoglycan/xylan/chitin deacetylase (PgdA/CDA1 family)